MKKRMTLYTKKRFKKVNPDNKMMLDDYMAELELQGKSRGTCYQYKSDIRAFLCWLLVNYRNANIIKVRKRVYRRFLLSLIKNQTSHNRINRLESSLRNFLQFLVESDDYPEAKTNYMAQVKGMKKKLVRKIVFLKDDQITKMLKYLLKHKKYQIATYLSLSYDSAARRNEVLQVTRKSMEDVINGNAKATNTVKGKEDKHFPLMVLPRSKRICAKWLKQRGKDDVKSLWRTKENGHYRQASYQTLYYWCVYLRKVLKTVDGKTVRFTPHSFRHSTLENMSNASFYYLRENGKKKIPLSILQLVAHHASISQTQDYLNPNDNKEKIAEAFNL